MRRDAGGYGRRVSDSDLTPDPEPEPGTAAEAVPATPGQRLAGAVVDGAVLQVAGLLLAGLDGAVAAALSTALYLVYTVALVAARGQTLGKLAVGTMVVDGTTGRLPTLWQAATRGVVPMAGVLIDVALGIAAVGVFWVVAVYGTILLDERRRGLHDKAAGTVVVIVERTELHRRVGVSAVVAALALTAVLVIQALGEIDTEELEGAHAPASESGASGRLSDTGTER